MVKNNFLDSAKHTISKFIYKKRVSKSPKNKQKSSKDKQFTFTKIVVLIIVMMAELQVTASYVLAFLGKENIAENLSKQTTVTVIGVALGYFLKSCVENISKYGGLKNNNNSSNECISENSEDIIISGDVLPNDSDIVNNDPITDSSDINPDGSVG